MENNVRDALHLIPIPFLVSKILSLPKNNFYSRRELEKFLENHRTPDNFHIYDLVKVLNEKCQALYNENGVAFIKWRNNTTFALIWYKKDKYHRLDGPAYISSCGYTSWWVNGKRHREDGPAIIDPENNKNEYYLHYKQYSKEDYDQMIQLKPFW